MGWFEDAWDNTVGKNSYIGSGAATNDIKKAGQAAIDYTIDPYKNLAVAVATGNYSNLDQSLVQAMVGPVGSVSPQALQYKETNIQRQTREAQEEAALAEMRASAEKERARLAGLADMLTASASARRLAPGMSQTLLGSTPSTALITTKA